MVNPKAGTQKYINLMFFGNNFEFLVYFCGFSRNVSFYLRYVCFCGYFFAISILIWLLLWANFSQDLSILCTFTILFWVCAVNTRYCFEVVRQTRLEVYGQTKWQKGTSRQISGKGAIRKDSHPKNRGGEKN